MMSQAQIPAGQRRDTQALSQNKDYASIQTELEFWFTINSARFSDEKIRLLKVWHIFKLGQEYDGEYLVIADYLFHHNIITQEGAEFLDKVFLRDKVTDREPDTLEEELLFIYHILRHNSPDYDIHSDPTSLWADANFSAA